jgi:hypothetical protein
MPTADYHSDRLHRTGAIGGVGLRAGYQGEFALGWQ